MSSNTYKITELVATSPESMEKAIEGGIKRAGETLNNLDWFEVTEVRGHIVDGKVAHYQVGLKIGFRLEDGQS